MKWINSEEIPSKKYKCGYCHSPISSQKGYVQTGKSSNMGQSYERVMAHIYICHECDNPTYFDYNGKQFPGNLYGNKVKHIDKPEVEKLFNEAKLTFSVGAYTATVMCCRKLLMNIAVTEGADENLNFYQYVTYLNDENYIPPKGKEWVDAIRKLGNEANHNIEFKEQNEAERILNFIEMLLRFIYELPGMMNDTI